MKHAPLNLIETFLVGFLFANSLHEFNANNNMILILQVMLLESRHILMVFSLFFAQILTARWTPKGGFVATGHVADPSVRCLSFEELHNSGNSSRSIYLDGAAAEGSVATAGGRKRAASQTGADGDNSISQQKKRKVLEEEVGTTEDRGVVSSGQQTQHKVAGGIVTGALHTQAVKPVVGGSRRMSLIKGEDSDAKRVNGLLSEIAQANRQATLQKERQRAAGPSAAENSIPAELTTLSSSGVLSLAPLIRQVLKTQDKQQTQQCLLTNDRRVIIATVRDLSAQHAVEWLHECATMLFQNPSRSLQLAEWIKQVLIQHASYFLAHPAAKKGLEPIYRNCQERMASHGSLLKVRSLTW